MMELADRKKFSDACEPWGYVAPVVAAVMTRATSVRHIYLINNIMIKTNFSTGFGQELKMILQPSKLKSRSLEPLTNLAMWSGEVLVIELVKSERGLGFSILDYQDPMNKEQTVIVIRSLVPGGVAQQDGRLIPGDRLM